MNHLFVPYQEALKVIFIEINLEKNLKNKFINMIKNGI